MNVDDNLDSDNFYDFWQLSGCAVVLCHNMRHISKITTLYKERHLVECFFNKIKAFRRVATRYDKLASSFLAFVHVASIWLLSK